MIEQNIYPLGAANQKRGKLTREQAVEIRRRYTDGGVTQQVLADEFGVTQKTISNAVNGKTWTATWAALSEEGQRERRRSQQAEYQRRHHRHLADSDPLYQRRRHYYQRYGLTVEQWEEFWDEQDGRCASCRDELVRSRATHIDHCHATNVVRGLLCSRCNQALGLLRNDANRIRGLLAYCEVWTRGF